MYAGRDENDIRDDIVFYCMNAYWETLIMQLPELQWACSGKSVSTHSFHMKMEKMWKNRQSFIIKIIKSSAEDSHDPDRRGKPVNMIMICWNPHNYF